MINNGKIFQNMYPIFGKSHTKVSSSDKGSSYVHTVFMEGLNFSHSCWQFIRVDVNMKNCHAARSTLKFSHSRRASMENSTIGNWKFRHIQNVTIKNCRNVIGNDIPVLLNVYNSSAWVENITIEDKNDTGWFHTVVVQDFGFLHIKRSKFVNNRVKNGAITVLNASTLIVSDCIMSNNHAYELAGVLFANNSFVHIRNSHFIDNKADESGGAIFADNSALEITSSEFFHNKATSGGAIICKAHSTARLNNCTFVHNSKTAFAAFNHTNVTFTNCRFENNSSPSYGGAIYLSHACVSNISQTTFVQNSASQGGAVSADNYSVLLMANCSFSENIAVSAKYGLNGTWATLIEFFGHSNIEGGGAISIINFSKAEILHSYFQNNSACYTGGALFASSKSSLSISFATFENNLAGACGGAIHVTLNCSVVLNESTLKSNSLSTKKRASGGGILGSLNSTLRFFKVNFLTNKAQYGGAIVGFYTSSITVLNSSFVSNTGSAIVLANKASLDIDYSSFMNNSTPFKGGAIVLSRHGFINVKNTIFSKNKAMTSGGAIHMEISNGASICNCLFYNNFSLKGGAVTAVYSDITNISQSTFTKNSATNGGVLASSGAILMSNCTVNNNTAKGNGGSLYLEEGSKINITKSEFNENSASGAGGVIWITKGSVDIKNSLIKGNIAGTNGGVISARNFCVVNIIHTICFENKAKAGDGGVLMGIDATRVFFNDTQLQQNSAYSFGVMVIDDNSVLELHHSHIDSNTGEIADGVFFISNNSLFITTYSSFTRNSGFGPGGMYLANSTGYLESCNLVENQGWTTGGAISISFVDLKISNTIFVDNIAPKGKDLYYESNENTTLDIYNCSFQHGNIKSISRDNNFKEFAIERNLMSCFLCHNQTIIGKTIRETPFASSEMLYFYIPHFHRLHSNEIKDLAFKSHS